MEALSRVLASPENAGRILLSAVSKPYIRYKPENSKPALVARQLRRFFMLMEGMEPDNEDS